MIINYGHRGASSYAPENTMAAFIQALQMGANGLETDLRRSDDGTIFLLHDALLDRTTNGSGLAAERSWEELSQLDAGSWFSEAFRGERLVTLEHFLYYFGHKPIHLALELKDLGIEEETLQLLRAYQPRATVAITSFDAASVANVKQLDPDMFTGILVRSFTEQTVEDVLQLGADQICPPAKDLTPEMVAYAKQRGLSVRAWHVKNEELMHHCVACGVDGMTLNFPDRLPQTTI